MIFLFALSLSISINRWTVAVLLTVLAWTWLVLWTRENGGGDFNFGPAIMGLLVFVGTVAGWLGLLIGRFL